MATDIGFITTLFGTVTAVSADGSQRILQIGDRIFAGEVISSAAGAGLEIEFTDGSVMAMAQNSQAVLDNEVFDPTSNNLDDNDDVESLQQAIIAGEDINEITDPTAAGSTTGVGEEGHSPKTVEFLGRTVSVTESGFETKDRTTSVETKIEEDQLVVANMLEEQTLLVDSSPEAIAAPTFYMSVQDNYSQGNNQPFRVLELQEKPARSSEPFEYKIDIHVHTHSASQSLAPVLFNADSFPATVYEIRDATDTVLTAVNGVYSVAVESGVDTYITMFSHTQLTMPSQQFLDSVTAGSEEYRSLDREYGSEYQLPGSEPVEQFEPLPFGLNNITATVSASDGTAAASSSTNLKIDTSSLQIYQKYGLLSNMDILEVGNDGEQPDFSMLRSVIDPSKNIDDIVVGGDENDAFKVLVPQWEWKDNDSNHGNDILIGGTGNDILIGGANSDDVFVWHKQDLGTSDNIAQDYVIDFSINDGAESSNNDILDLSDLLSDGSHSIEGLAADSADLLNERIFDEEEADEGQHLQLAIKNSDNEVVQTIDLVNISVTEGIDNPADMLEQLLQNGNINNGLA